MPLTPDNPHEPAPPAQLPPTEWINPTPYGRYNLVVIGGSAAGMAAAVRVAELGARAALVDTDLPQGNALKLSLVGRRALVESARLAHTLQTAGQFGISIRGATVNFGDVMERVRGLCADAGNCDCLARAAGHGVDVYLGDARFTGRANIDVAGQT